MPHILIVEDEAAIADTLLYALQAEGFATTWVTLAGEAPGVAGAPAGGSADPRRRSAGHQRFRGLQRLRRFSEVPVIFLTARDAEIDRVVGLEIGADDYVVKPFSPREVAARVKAILKRMAPRPAALEEGRAEQAVPGRRGARADPLPRHPAQPHPPRVPPAADAARAARAGIQPRAVARRPRRRQRGRLRAQHRQPHQESARQAAPGERTRRSDQTHRGLGYSYSPDHA